MLPEGQLVTPTNSSTWLLHVVHSMRFSPSMYYFVTMKRYNITLQVQATHQ